MKKFASVFLIASLTVAAFAEAIPCGEFRQFAVVQSDGKTNVVSVCGFDEKKVRVDVVAPPAGELQTTSRLGREAGAIAALNGSYYVVRDPWPCENYLAIDGCELSPGGMNAVTHTVRCDGMVYTRSGRVFMSQDPNGRNVNCEDALASGPVLMLAGRRTDLSVFPAHDSFYASRHPRSAIGRTADGRVLLIAVDGRFRESVGMSISELQDLTEQLGCRDAVNLDGGGSTTLWAEGKVRNHPSDNQRFDATGERRVQNAIVVSPAAELEPADNAVVPLVPDAYRRFLSLPRETRRSVFTNAAERARMDQEFPPNHPLAVRFSWPEGPGELVVERQSDGKPFHRGKVGANTCVLRNFEIACGYRWRVVPTKGAPSPWRTFRTEDTAPRLIDWPGVPNVRDLGGRKGLGGRRVRQGLVYRSAGLNGNASGKPGARKPGAVRLTAESARWGREVLGIRTDLDLRSPPEVEFMTGSPLGPEVRWINLSAANYGGLAGKTGRESFVKCFRVFLDEKNYPIVFHCIAGADRTGSLACILNGLLGVDEEELVRDWEVTGLVGGHGVSFSHASRYDKLIAVFDRYAGRTLNERIEAYVRDCGITADEIATFRRIMLEGPAAPTGLLPVIPQPGEWHPSSGASVVAADGMRTGTDFSCVTFERAAGFAAEEYEVRIAAEGIVVRAADALGFECAKATLVQLASRDGRLPAGVIRDRPKYRMRGLVLDVGRKPYSMSFLRGVAKTLAYYKMNVFHIHLNDDGASVFTGPDRPVHGFRLESERYPDLASSDQHYTKDEFRTFVKECASMGVTVIPEIDSPAHSGAFRRYLRSQKPVRTFDIVSDFTNAVRFVEGLYDEYLGGDDPVFAGPYVHVGMDEFGPKHVDAYRAYGRELYRIVGKYGKKVCVWGSSEHPETPDGDLLVDIWSATPDGYDPLKMMAHGYNTLCTQGGQLYIVPAAGYYNDYLAVRRLYEHWEPNVFGPKSMTDSGNPRLYGGKFAVWNDLSENGISEDDTFARIFPAIQTLSQKMWSGTREDEGWEDFARIAEGLHEAPGVNLADRLTGADGTVAADDTAVGWSQGGGYTVSFELRPNPSRTVEEALFDDGFSRVTLTADGRLGFSRDGIGHVFLTHVPAGIWTDVSFTGDADGVCLFTDGVFRESTKGLNKFCENWCGRGYSLYLRSPRTLHFPLVRQKFGGEIRAFSVRTGYERRLLTLDADRYRRADGVADVQKMADEINASGADEVTVLHARRDLPVEGGKQRHVGEADVLAFRCCMQGRYGTLVTGKWEMGSDGIEKTTAVMSRRRPQ